jgi:hypothetical protein
VTSPLVRALTLAVTPAEPGDTHGVTVTGQKTMPPRYPRIGLTGPEASAEEASQPEVREG